MSAYLHLGFIFEPKLKDKNEDEIKVELDQQLDILNSFWDGKLFDGFPVHSEAVYADQTHKYNDKEEFDHMVHFLPHSFVLPDHFFSDRISNFTLSRLLGLFELQF